MFFCPPLREREREKLFCLRRKRRKKEGKYIRKNQNISISFKNHRDVISLRLYIVFIVEYNIIEKYFSLFD